LDEEEPEDELPESDEEEPEDEPSLPLLPLSASAGPIQPMIHRMTIKITRIFTRIPITTTDTANLAIRVAENRCS